MPKIKTKIQNPLTTILLITLFDHQILLYTVFIFFLNLVFLNFTIAGTKKGLSFLFNLLQMTTTLFCPHSSLFLRVTQAVT